MADLRMRSRAGLATGALLALLLLAPLLGPGYVLIRDMAFVPRTPIGGQLLGLDGVPRGVPSELLVALASRVIATGWLQDLVLVALVVGGTWGAARLAPTTSRAAAASAGTAYGWSAYLHERLLLGQWALLVGWAVLPWAVRAAVDWRKGGPATATVGALAVAALAGANALLIVALVVVICGKPLQALAASLVLGLPWIVPGLLQDQVAGDPRGVNAFASNSDTPLGTVGSLLTGGGVWSREAAPPSRSVGVWVALAVLVVAVMGVRRVDHRLSAAAAAGLVLALLGVFPPTREALRWAVVHVPATGLLRDGQKWIAPLVLLVSIAFACAVEGLVSKVTDAGARKVLAGVLVLAPVAALPGAAWGEGGTLSVSHYPADWERVTSQAHGNVLVLPWSLYRAFPWDDRTTVLDPATKLLQHPVVNDALPLPGAAVRGEDPLAARLSADVLSGQPLLAKLRAAGVDQVLVEHTTAGADPVLAASQTTGLTPVAQTTELSLFDVPGSRSTRHQVKGWPVVLADLVALGLIAGAGAQGLRRRLRRSGPT